MNNIDQMFNNPILTPIIIGILCIATGFLPPKNYKSIGLWMLGGINIVIGIINYFIK